MDFLYFYKKTEDDFELRYSLRSIARHAPWARKVWIYGDRPDFITGDTGVVEHVPHSLTAPVLNLQPPIKNFFLMLFLSSLIPELTSDYVWCSDDHFLLKDYSVDDARKVRYLQHEREFVTRPSAKYVWKSQLWYTHDHLIRLGYSGHNFETHTPIWLTKRRVMNAYCAFRDYVTNDAWAGFMGASAILNHAHKHDTLPIIDIRQEGSCLGVTPDQHFSRQDLAKAAESTVFLFYAHGALNDTTRRFLMDRFPSRSRYERAEELLSRAGESIEKAAFHSAANSHRSMRPASARPLSKTYKHAPPWVEVPSQPLVYAAPIGSCGIQRVG